MSVRKPTIAIALSLVALLAVWLIFQRAEKDTFPTISKAAYVGTISGLLANPNDKSTFYIERLSNLPVLLVYIFIEDFEPKLIPLAKSPSGAFKKIELRLNDKLYHLSGSLRSSRMQGDLLLGEKEVGSWQLSETEDSIFAELTQGKLENKVSRLVMNHARHESLKAEFDAVTAAYKKQSKKFVELQTLMNDRAALATYAKEKKQVLDEELKLALSEREQVSKKVEGELENLHYARRTRKLGQAISRARKIAKREGAWYLASLPEDDQSEPFPQQASELDLNSQTIEPPPIIEVDPKLIQEYRRLEEDVARERKAIGILEKRLLERRATTEDKKGKKDRWWRFWD